MAEHLRAAGYRTAILGSGTSGCASWALPRARASTSSWGCTGTVDYFQRRATAPSTGTTTTAGWRRATTAHARRSSSTRRPPTLARNARRSGSVPRDAERSPPAPRARGARPLPAAVGRGEGARGDGLRPRRCRRRAHRAGAQRAGGAHARPLPVRQRRAGHRRRLRHDEGASSLLDLELVAVGSRSIWKGARRPPPGVGSPPHGVTELGDTGTPPAAARTTRIRGGSTGLRGRRALRRVRVVGAAQPRARRLVARRPLPRSGLVTDARQAGGRLDGDEPAARRLRRPAGADEGRRRLAEDEVPVNIAACGPTRTARGASSTARRRRSSSASSSSSSTALAEPARPDARAARSLTADPAEAHDLAGRDKTT